MAGAPRGSPTQISLVGDEVSLDIQVELHQKKDVAVETAQGAASKAPVAGPQSKK